MRSQILNAGKGVDTIYLHCLWLENLRNAFMRHGIKESIDKGEKKKGSPEETLFS